MTDPAPLTLAFINDHPGEAAKTLAMLPPGDAASFLDSIPTRFAVSVLSRMGIWPAAAILGDMAPASGGAALQAMDDRDAAAILRLSGKDIRTRLIEALPAKRRRAFERALAYPDTAVGAHMTTEILTVTARDTVGEVIAQIRRSTPAETDTAFMVDDAKRYLGALKTADLLIHPDAIEMATIADSSVQPLSPRAGLSAVAELDAWAGYAALPVVNRQNYLLGGLSRRRLHRSQARGQVSGGGKPSSIAVAIGEMLLISVAGLAELVTDRGPLREDGERS